MPASDGIGRGRVEVKDPLLIVFAEVQPRFMTMLDQAANAEAPIFGDDLNIISNFQQLLRLWKRNLTSVAMNRDALHEVRFPVFERISIDRKHPLRNGARRVGILPDTLDFTPRCHFATSEIRTRRNRTNCGYSVETK